MSSSSAAPRRAWEMPGRARICRKSPIEQRHQSSRLVIAARGAAGRHGEEVDADQNGEAEPVEAHLVLAVRPPAQPREQPAGHHGAPSPGGPCSSTLVVTTPITAPSGARSGAFAVSSRGPPSQ
jgi:hypothetical protein